MPEEARAISLFIDVESSARQSGDTLIIQLCCPHNGPADLAMIVVQPDQK